MTFLGISHVIIGLSAIFRDHLALMEELHDDYLLKFSVTTWGWIHLVLGVVLLVLAAFGIFGGERWARSLAIVAVILSALTAIGWLPYLPFWAAPILFIDAVIVWIIIRTLDEAHAGT